MMVMMMFSHYQVTTSWAGQEADNLSTGSYSAVFTSVGLKLGGSSHKAIEKPPMPENFPSESI